MANSLSSTLAQTEPSRPELYQLVKNQSGRRSIKTAPVFLEGHRPVLNIPADNKGNAKDNANTNQHDTHLQVFLKHGGVLPSVCAARRVIIHTTLPVASFTRAKMEQFSTVQK